MRREISVEDFIRYQEQGFLMVREVIAPDELDELLGHIEGLANGALPRVHMLHR